MILPIDNVAGRGVWCQKNSTVLETQMDLLQGCSIDSYGNDGWLVQCRILLYCGEPRMGLHLLGHE